MPNKLILVTGASGFIGKILVKTLCHDGYNVRATVRSEHSLNVLSDYKTQFNLKKLTIYNLGELNAATDWSPVIHDVDTIIHCAARAHVLQETSANPLATFRQNNCDVTEQLAKAAMESGVRRFIFLSSIGVLGNSSFDTPFNEYSVTNPHVPYAQAKLEAEQFLKNLPGSMELVIIRPPLVYGPGVKGNFLKLLKLISKGLPLPFGRIQNRRQFIGVDNLVDFILTCISSPKAANQVFLVADQESVSTTQLIELLSQLMGRKLVLLPVPHKLLEWSLQLIDKKKLAEQLLNNLEINSEHAKTLLNWEPPFSMQEQLKLTIEDYIGGC